MKKILAILVAAIFFVGCGDSNTESNKTEPKKMVLKVGVSADYPPFEFINDKNNITGFDIELLSAVGKKVNFETKIQNISFDGLIPALKAGKIDLVISAMSATETRRKSIDFTDSYYSTKNLFICKKDENITQDMLAGKKIGVQLGTIQEAAAKMINGAEVVPAESIINSVLALKAGKIDVVLVDSSIGYEYLKQNDDLKEFLKLPDGSEGFSIAFDKDKHTKLISEINKAIKDLKEDGTFDTIMEKYNLK